MARSFYSAVKQVARAADRAQRAAVRDQARRHREMQRDQQRRAREADRNARQAARDAKLRYLEEREDEVLLLNEELSERVEEISSLLLASPESARPISFSSLRKRFQQTVFADSAVGPPPVAPTADQYRTAVPPLGFFARIFGGKAKHEEEVASAAESDGRAYERAKAAYESDLIAWQASMARAREQHEHTEATKQREVEEHNRVVEQFEADYLRRSPEAVRDYATLILERSILPEGFPETFRLAYIPESKQLVVEHDLPTLDVVPSVAEYSYVKGKDEIRDKPRKKGEAADLYRRAVASVALRVLNEVFSSDVAEAISVAVFNGVVHTIDPGTGEEISPCLISVRATKEEFSRIVLERVDPLACLKSLNASVSKKAEELAPVRPVIEFDMVDHRFIAEESCDRHSGGAPQHHGAHTLRV